MQCTGDTPCQTCTEVQTECVYDPTMDRRSKAYFQRRLADGLANAVRSEKNPDELISMLQDNASLDSDVEAELQKALQLRQQSPEFSTSPDVVVETPQDANNVHHQTGSFICTTFCAAVGSPKARWMPDKFQREQALKIQGPVHSITPYAVPDQSPFSLLFDNFKDGVRDMLAQGTPLAHVLGPLDPVADLFFRPREPTDPFSASTWACELARLDEQADLHTQLANAFLLSRFMRWHIAPTLENFLLLPEIMRPTLSQRTIPHFASADLYAIPAVRDSLVRGSFELAEPIGMQGTKGIKFHWPFHMDKAIEFDPVTGTRVLSRLFSVCASEPSNWSCSKDFLANSPMTRASLNVIDHQHSWNELPPATPAN